MTEPDYVLTNRAHWDRHADEWVEMGERAWAAEPSWGMWGIPESELRLLPEDMSGMRAVELGCGTGYISAWMARRGADVLAIDNSERQLETARRLAAEHGVPDIEFVHGNAEAVSAPDASFDFAITEYGVAIWADPYVWVPEAHRVLKPGGRLIMLGNHPLVFITTDWTVDEPVARQLINPYFGMHRVEYDVGDDPSVEFNLPISEWFRLFTDTGFDVVAYHELQAPQPGREVRFYATADWAHDYPTEQVWNVRKRD